MMDELGNILREAREAKGLTLAEVQKATRINTRFIEALESSDYSALPTPVHVRGFLKNYARFLELNPEPLLDRYTASQNHKRPPIPISGNENITPDQPLPSRDDQPFFNPVNVDLNPDLGRGSDSTLRVIIIVAFIVAIGLAVARFLPIVLGEGDGQDSLTTVIEQLLQGDVEPTATIDEETAEPTPIFTPLPISPTERNNPNAIPTEAPPTPTRPTLPGTMEVIQLRLDISERTWLRVTIDNEVVFEGQAMRGDGPFQWDAQESANVLTGNAVGVIVNINGIEWGRMGERGKVAEETWTTTGN